MWKVATSWAFRCSLLGLLWASACATAARVPQTPLAAGARSFAIAGVGACEDPQRSAWSLTPERPLVVLVHGAHAQGGAFAALTEAFTASGAQAVCFRYDSRASVRANARLLRAATTRLASELRSREITLLGHSQGGLIAREALTAQAAPLPQASYRLVTISAPFAGIRIARSCASIPYSIVSLGVSTVVCRAISGASWTEIHPGARMVRDPSPLDSAVREHLAILTDERDSCRRFSADGLSCLQDDYVFSLAEQQNAALVRDPRVTEVPLRAGHVEVVGAHGQPRKLIEALQQHGVLAPDRGEHASVFDSPRSL